MLYSKCNKLKINDWIPPLKISKQKTIQRNIKNKWKKNNIQWKKKNLTATDNNSISKEPDKRLIDKRFDNEIHLKEISYLNLPIDEEAAWNLFPDKTSE